MSEPTEELKGNEPKREKVRIIPVELIDDFPNHPFQVKDDAVPPITGWSVPTIAL